MSDVVNVQKELLLCMGFTRNIDIAIAVPNDIVMLIMNMLGTLTDSWSDADKYLHIFGEGCKKIKQVDKWMRLGYGYGTRVIDIDPSLTNRGYEPITWRLKLFTGRRAKSTRGKSILPSMRHICCGVGIMDTKFKFIDNNHFIGFECEYGHLNIGNHNDMFNNQDEITISVDLSTLQLRLTNGDDTITKCIANISKGRYCLTVWLLCHHQTIQILH